MARNLANLVRDFRCAKRDLTREHAVNAAVEASSARLEGWLVAEQTTPGAAAQREEEAVRLTLALATLPESQREAVLLRYWHAWSLAEIAAQLGTSVDAVTGLLYRGLKTLRTRLRGSGDGE
jgi:RNA polymerase sigma factor (sigma-70 family)